MHKATIGEKYYLHSVVVSALLFLFYSFGINNSFLYSSIFNYKNIKSDPFDGTVYPIEFVPNPLELNYSERKKSYLEIDSKYFIKTPIYDPSVFERDLDTLTPGSKDYKETIVQRLIYTVPYLGTYNFDFKEFSGSHPGVDIVAPERTPVRSIAAGVVVSVGSEGNGFGNYVLIRHDNVPLPSGGHGDIYSLYAHLFSSTVNAGNKIKKGEIVGYVGKTGTATTPHLHFQIDLSTAPHSPYWPFNSADMKKAKVGFFEGINIGLGKEKAIMYTINPLKFVNRNLSFGSSLTGVLSVNSLNQESKEAFYEGIKTQTGKEDLTQNNSGIEDIVESNLEENIAGESGVVGNNLEKVIASNNSGIILMSSRGDEIEEYKETILENSFLRGEENNYGELKTENDSQALKKESLLESNIEILSTIDANVILPDSTDILHVKKDDNLSFSKINDLLDNSSSENNSDLEFLDESLNSFNPYIEESHLSQNNSTFSGSGSQPNLLPDAKIGKEKRIFSDIKSDYKYIKELSYFKNKNIISGFRDGSFRPTSNITRIESLKIILLANSIKLVEDKTSKFLDLDGNFWGNIYINSALKLNIISRNNNKFYPHKNISRIEALKLILNLASVDFSKYKEDDLKLFDVKKSDWYYKYVNYAIKNNLFEIKNGRFYPNKPITREELIFILYKMTKA